VGDPVRRAVPAPDRHSHGPSDRAPGSGHGAQGVMRRVGLLVLIVVAWPLLVPRYFVFLASLVLVNAIVAMGLNLLSGYTHQLSFGHAGFLAIGAYTTALLGLHARGLPAPLALLGAGVVTAAVGVALGLPCLRLEGLYLTM